MKESRQVDSALSMPWSSVCIYHHSNVFKCEGWEGRYLSGALFRLTHVIHARSQIRPLALQFASRPG